MARADAIARRRRRWRALDVAAALAELAAERRYVPARGRRRHRVRDRGRAPSGGRGGAGRRRRALRRQRLRSRRRGRRGSGCSPAPTWPASRTFLRQNALIAILAQIGAFVPATRGAHRRRRPAVQPRRRRRRSGARPLDLHGRDGRDRGDPEPGRAARAGDPRRDRPRHRDLRRAVDRLGGARASARGQPLPRAVRHALPRADGAGRASCRRSPATRCGSRNGRATSCSCTRSRPAPPTAPTASMSRGSPACRRR